MQRDTKQILRFIGRTLLVALPLPLIAVALYAVCDPYRVIRDYGGDYFSRSAEDVRTGINKGVVTLSAYNAAKARGEQPNSFIFGASISCCFDARTWAEYLEDSVRIVPFHFDSSGESLVSLAAKIDYLCRNSARLRHALVVLDPLIMERGEVTGPFAMDPPALHPGAAYLLKFHYTYLRATVNADFLKSMAGYALTGRAVQVGRNPIFQTQPVDYDRAVNQENLSQWDALISADPEAYYSVHPLAAPAKAVSESAPVLDDEKREALRAIAGRFRQAHTDYRIVIMPNRRKVSLNAEDRAFMRGIFAPDRVRDLSAVMAPMLDADTMMYDNVHFRPAVALAAMDSVYGRR